MINFLNQLRNTNWENLNEYNYPVNACGSFLHKYTALFNECFPLKHIKASKHCLTKPWISKCLLKSIRKKNRLYRKFLKFPTSQNEINYKQYRNKLSSLLRIAKRLHYEEKLNLAKTNVKRTWQVLNEILQRRGNKANKIPSNLFTSNRNISDPMEIANQFCNYFSNIGLNLVKNIPVSQYILTTLILTVILSILFFCNQSRNWS